MTRVLVVEDDAPLRRAIRMNLEGRQVDVVEASNGEEGVLVAADRRPDAVILDLTLPGIDGLAVLERLRSFTDAPVIVVTGREDADDKLAAFDAGADDYVVKPFDPRELVARLNATLRRSDVSHERAAVVRSGELVIDLARRMVTLAGEPVHLTRTELELLEVLVRNPFKLLTHDYLLRQVWGGSTRRSYVRVYVQRLRAKLHDDAEHPRLISTEAGIGYRWIAGADN
jgi:two-component system KDP operon response regulator KdpE